jgi:hypothetical protein
MTGSTDTPRPGDAEYRALMEHCVDCPECRATPETACPLANTLRHEWSMARRTGAVR